MAERKLRAIGKIAHYFSKIGVAVIELTDTLSVGDRILVRGPTTSFEQTIQSMQIEHENVATAQGGQSVGLKVDQRVREEDKVYKIVA